MAHVAPALLGEPNRRLSRPSAGELRYGNRGSLVVHIPPHHRAGRWRDFESGEGGGVIDLVARENGVGETAAMDWLRQSGFLTVAHQPPTASRPTIRSPGNARIAGPPPPSPTGTDYPARRWAQGQPIPTDPAHPIRRWMARRHLWRPGHPLPATLRWEPADNRQPPTCAGRMLVPLAPLADWIAAWPKIPQAQAMQVIAIGGDGAPALDRPAHVGGLDKRTIGGAEGAVFAVGGHDTNEVRVCEGVADALAIASRYDALTIAAMSAGQFLNSGLLERLTRAANVVIHSDADRSAAGQGAAIRLANAINAAGGNARATSPAAGYKDPAEWAATHPHAPILPDVARAYADTLAEMYPSWPIWERYRLASIAATDTNQPTEVA